MSAMVVTARAEPAGVVSKTPASVLQPLLTGHCTSFRKNEVDILKAELFNFVGRQRLETGDPDGTSIINNVFVFNNMSVVCNMFVSSTTHLRPCGAWRIFASSGAARASLDNMVAFDNIRFGRIFVFHQDRVKTGAAETLTI